MNEIEKKALAMAERLRSLSDIATSAWTQAVATEAADLLETQAHFIEQHEAFKREVSDAVKGSPLNVVAKERLKRFILPKPVDPFLIEAREVCARVEEERDNPDWATRYRSGQYDELGWVKHIRAALAARGGRIVWEGE